MLQEHTPAPDFTLRDQDGKEQTLSRLQGQYVLVYFYPKDDTPGCTKEACAIRDSYNDYALNYIKVLGISADSPESHKAFATKYELPFTLLSDPEKRVIDAYGAKTFVGIKRISYLISPSGDIAKVYPSVDPTTHAMQILADVAELKQAQS